MIGSPESRRIGRQLTVAGFMGFSILYLPVAIAMGVFRLLKRLIFPPDER